MDFKQAGIFGFSATLVAAVLQLFLGFLTIPAQAFFFWAIAIFVVGKFLFKFDLIPLAIVSVVTAFVMLVADQFVVGEIVGYLVRLFPALMPAGFVLTAIFDIIVVAIVLFAIDLIAFKRN